jgi:hypothetical protein
MRKTPSVGTLTLVCSKTGGQVRSGVIYDQVDLQRAGKARLQLHCPHCGVTHLFKFSDARLTPIQSGEK